MASIRCGYCGDGDTGVLDNGSPACPECRFPQEDSLNHTRKT